MRLSDKVSAQGEIYNTSRKRTPPKAKQSSDDHELRGYFYSMEMAM